MPNITPRNAVALVEKQKERKYSTKEKKFLTLFANNDFKEARECFLKAGYSDKSCYTNVLARLKPDIKEIGEMLLLEAAPEAAMTMTRALRENTPQSRLSAAKEILDRVGIVKEEKHSHEHEVSGGVFLIPAKQEVRVVEAYIEEENDEGGEYAEDGGEYYYGEYEDGEGEEYDASFSEGTTSS